METETKDSFKAVEFMRQVRNDLSGLYHTDKKRYYNELKKLMDNFLAGRTKSAATNVTPKHVQDNKYE